AGGRRGGAGRRAPPPPAALDGFSADRNRLTRQPQRRRSIAVRGGEQGTLGRKRREAVVSGRKRAPENGLDLVQGRLCAVELVQVAIEPHLLKERRDENQLM